MIKTWMAQSFLVQIEPLGANLQIIKKNGSFLSGEQEWHDQEPVRDPKVDLMQVLWSVITLKSASGIFGEDKKLVVRHLFNDREILLLAGAAVNLSGWISRQVECKTVKNETNPFKTSKKAWDLC